MPTKTNNTRHFARFLRWLATMVAVYFVITAILSLTVDPWRINNTRFSIESLDEYREISNTVRVGKAALANRGHWETVILGSSRIEIGLDPTHPVFDGSRTVNLAMSAANLNETVPAGLYLLQRNPEVKTLILGIEPGDLHNDFDSRKFTRFYQSPFADNNRSIERGINQVIGGRSLADSIATIKRKSSGKMPIRSSLGQWLQPNHPADLRAYAESTFQMGFESPVDSWQLRPQKIRPHKAEMLTDFIELVRGRGITMILVVPPQHALKFIHPIHDAPEMICWEHDLLALAAICKKANEKTAPGPPVRLWSFLTFNELTTRPMPQPGGTSLQMPGWFDLGHGQPVLGDLVLETILGESDGPHDGINLLDDDYEARRAEWIEKHEQYCRNNPDDVAWWRGLVAQFWDTNKAPRPMADVAE